MALGDKTEIDGETVEWNGFGLVWCAGLCFIPLSEEPTLHEIAILMTAWRHGVEHGKHMGRSILQNEFRNLMACQPK